jgi:hypothetical protein
MNDENVIQLINGIVIIVNDVEFKRAICRYKSFFNFSNFLVIKDTRGHIFFLRKENILLFENCNGQKIKKQTTVL